mmetsp:Transcript_18388/g.36050  ORF Transcript_18388/g.36050 Transcript_18388/m.36050 type:complete len:372 (-) Transcript_18388:176-1291(-)
MMSSGKGGFKGNGGRGKGDRGKGFSPFQQGGSSGLASSMQDAGVHEQSGHLFGFPGISQDAVQGNLQSLRTDSGKGRSHGRRRRRRVMNSGAAPSCCWGDGRHDRGARVGWLFVRNLPGNVRVDALKYVFANYGKVVKICVMNGRSAELKACAFIKYLFSCEAALAIQMLHGKYEMQPGHGPIAVKADAPGVFVENLPADIAEDMVDFMFSFYGQVQTVHITTEHSRSGRARAFVEYSSAAEAEMATQALYEGQQEQGTAEDLSGHSLSMLAATGPPASLHEVRAPNDVAAGMHGKPLPSSACGWSAQRMCRRGGTEAACVVCLTEPRSHAFIPCGHRCVCADCGSTVMDQASATCPLCRGTVADMLQIFC